MRVERLQIDTAPGLPRGLPELEFDPGLTLIVGPNASGKSTVARALRELLWPDAETSDAGVRSHWHAAESAHAAGLFAGKVSWQPPLATPVPAGAAGLARFGVHSLLAPDDDNDEALGRRIALELAGGLDFAAAAARFGSGLSPRKLKQAAKARDLARRNLQQAKHHTRELAGKEADLASLSARIAAAEGAGQNKAAAERLLELVRALEVLARLESQTHAPGLELLLGDEAERIRVLERELVERESTLSALETELAHLAAMARDNAFPKDPPDRREFDTWAERLDELALSDRKLEEERSVVAGLAQQLSEHRARVGTQPPAGPPPTALLDELGRGIAGVRAAEAELRCQQDAAATWESWAEGSDQDPDSLRGAIRDLRTWLRSPAAGTAAHATTAPAGLAWALIVAGLLCAGLAMLIGQPWLAAGLFLTGLGVAQLKSGSEPAAPVAEDSARAAARQALERSPHAPSSWDAAAVDEHLTELQRQLARIEEAHSAARQLGDARRALDKAEQHHAERERALHELAAKVGATQEFVELGDLERIQALIEWLNLGARHAELAARLEQLEAERARKLDECASWLRGHGAAAPADAAGARAALTELRNRRDDLLEARDRTRAAERTRDEQDLARAAAAEEADRLWVRAGVTHGDLAALTRRLEERKSWADHQEALRFAARDVAGCRERFAGAGELPQLGGVEPESVTSEQVERWIGDLDAELQVLADLTGSAGGITRELQLAAEGHGLEDALAKLVEAEQGVADERELAIVDSLARGLLDEARAQHETAHAPPTLQRAQERFGRFTRGGWRLDLGPDETFRAHDLGTGQARSLAELSDGTRAQLLLAVRLAALEELEPEHAPLPVCLDETLSITDPVRFRAIASALLELADDGRQLLYFTADPGEVAQWLQVCAELGRPPLRVLDLAALQGAPQDWGGELPALPPAPELVPDPTGQTPAEYARRLGVPAPDAFDPIAGWHLYLAAHDDLDALAACLRNHLKSIGHWREACRRDVTPREISSESARRISARADLAAELAEAWRIGRGRPVTWDDVKASGAVSSTFEDRVLPLLAEHARDPQRFAALVGEVNGFRRAQLDKLTAHLEQSGCLDLEPRLSEEDLVLRALQSAPEASALLGTEQAASFVAWLISLLRD